MCKHDMIIISCVAGIVKEELKMLYNCDSVSALEACEEARLGEEHEVEYDADMVMLGGVIRRGKE